MTATQSIRIQPRERGLNPGARLIRNRRRSTAPAAAGRHHTGAPGTPSPDRSDPARQASGAEAARGQILRRWSVTDLIARAGGAPRAFA
jgi:hypothetical protein